jgi:nitrate reductase NapE component
LPIIQAGDRRTSDNETWQTVIDIAAKLFPIAAIATVLIYGYIFYGLFSGQLGDAVGQTAQQGQHALELIKKLSLWLNISLVVMLLTSLILHNEEASVGWVYLGLAALFAYGLNYIIDFLMEGDAARLKTGAASSAAFSELQLTAIFFAVAGVILVVRQLWLRVTGQRGEDLANVAAAKDIGSSDDVPRALIGAAAKCWQLPFCREGIRKNCPIYHARTKCWKQRVGCMCEENVIRLAAGGQADQKPVDMTQDVAKGAGFVPIGDLIVENQRKNAQNLPTRVGPRGVRIPTNPHLTDAQKKMRCHNCVIYNEHQRQKYQLIAPFVTLLVPLLVWWKFDDLRTLIFSAMQRLDVVFGRLSFSGESSATSAISQMKNTLGLDVIILFCLALVFITWALRLLEYCTFKLKI